MSFTNQSGISVDISDYFIYKSAVFLGEYYELLTNLAFIILSEPVVSDDLSELQIVQAIFNPKHLLRPDETSLQLFELRLLETDDNEVHSHRVLKWVKL